MSDHMQQAREMLRSTMFGAEAPKRIAALLAERSALAARVGALREALLRFGAHEQNCDVYEMDEEGSGRCNCGYAAAMASPSAPAEAAPEAPSDEDRRMALAAALGWPGGISAEPADWPALLAHVARLRVAAPEAPAERRGRVHCLKTWPEFFREVKAGNKPFEVRRNDRDFRVGDVLALQEWDRGRQDYTGDVLTRRVSYLLEGPAFGIGAGFVVMGLEGCAPEEPAEPEYKAPPMKIVGRLNATWAEAPAEPVALPECDVRGCCAIDAPYELWGREKFAAAIAAARAEGAKQMREQCAQEAEHWQKISATPGHTCGQHIAAALRALPVEAPNAAGKAPAR